MARPVALKMTRPRSSGVERLRVEELDTVIELVDEIKKTLCSDSRTGMELAKIRRTLNTVLCVLACLLIAFSIVVLFFRIA